MTKVLAANGGQTKYHCICLLNPLSWGKQRTSESPGPALQSLYASHNNPPAPLQFRISCTSAPKVYTLSARWVLIYGGRDPHGPVLNRSLHTECMLGVSV